MTDFRYYSHGGKRFDQLNEQGRTAQLQHLLARTRAALDYILVQTRAALAIRPSGVPMFADASFTFALPDVETVYANISVIHSSDSTVTVNIGVRQLQEHDGEQVFGSLIAHNAKEFEELFSSYDTSTCVVQTDGTDSFITLTL